MATARSIELVKGRLLALLANIQTFGPASQPASLKIVKQAKRALIDMPSINDPYKTPLGYEIHDGYALALGLYILGDTEGANREIATMYEDLSEHWDL
jgi:hypothetical protein